MALKVLSGEDERTLRRMVQWFRQVEGRLGSRGGGVGNTGGPYIRLAQVVDTIAAADHSTPDVAAGEAHFATIDVDDGNKIQTFDGTILSPEVKVTAYNQLEEEVPGGTYVVIGQGQTGRWYIISSLSGSGSNVEFFMTPSDGIPAAVFDTATTMEPGEATCTKWEWNAGGTKLEETATTESVRNSVPCPIGGDKLVTVSRDDRDRPWVISEPCCADPQGNPVVAGDKSVSGSSPTESITSGPAEPTGGTWNSSTNTAVINFNKDLDGDSPVGNAGSWEYQQLNQTQGQPGTRSVSGAAQITLSGWIDFIPSGSNPPRVIYDGTGDFEDDDGLQIAAFSQEVTVI